MLFIDRTEMRGNASIPEGRVRIQMVSTNTGNKTARETFKREKCSRQCQQEHIHQMENKQELVQTLGVHSGSQTENEQQM